jgi:hypothetical protein
MEPQPRSNNIIEPPVRPHESCRRPFSGLIRRFGKK